MRFALYVAGIICSVSLSATAHESRPHKLPLGDGYVSFTPQRGYIFSCQSQFAGGGAFRDGPWIQDTYWYPDGKIHVGGDVPWPQARIHFQRDDRTRIISGNGLPVNQTTGIYPVRRTDEAYHYDRNMNAVKAQRIKLMLDAQPSIAKTPSCLPMGMIGVTVTGVGIFNGLDAMGRDAGAHEIHGRCSGHPEQHGQYHYHNWSDCIPDHKDSVTKHSGLVGYMLDGFGIYGPYGNAGVMLTNADLDVCHGHTHEIDWDGKKMVLYHYHFTMEYPYTAGCFKGTPELPLSGAR